MAHSDRSPRTIRLLTALLLVATFAAGTVTGAGVYRWADSGRGHSGPPPMPGPVPFEELDLTADQQAKVRSILEAHRPELEAVIRDTYPKVLAINDKMDAEIRAILTPEQVARFDRIKARRPPPPPPGGPGPGGGMGPGMGPGPRMGPGPGMPPGSWLPPPPRPAPPTNEVHEAK